MCKLQTWDLNLGLSDFKSWALDLFSLSITSLICQWGCSCLSVTRPLPLSLASFPDPSQLPLQDLARPHSLLCPQLHISTWPSPTHSFNIQLKHHLCISWLPPLPAMGPHSALHVTLTQHLLTQSKWSVCVCLPGHPYVSEEDWSSCLCHQHPALCQQYKGSSRMILEWFRNTGSRFSWSGRKPEILSSAWLPWQCSHIVSAFPGDTLLLKTDRQTSRTVR